MIIFLLATIKPPDILGVRKSFSGVIMKKPPSIINLWSAKLQIYIRGGIVMSNYTDDLHSLSHTKWNCKYHVVFAPKYRRKAFYDARRVEIGKILRDLCNWKGVNILEAEVCVDHVHMLIEVPPKMSVSGFMGFLKGKSSQMIYEKWANARFKYRNRSFWCRGYYVDTVGKNTKKIEEYIKNQLKEDRTFEQLELEFEDPFTGKQK